MNLANHRSAPEKKAEDLTRINAILAKNERLVHNVNWIEKVTDELIAFQPFVIAVFMGYKGSLLGPELEEFARLLAAIWEYFNIDPKARTERITEDRFLHFQKRNLNKFEILDPDEVKITTILQEALFEQFKTRTVLINMKLELKLLLMIDIKTLVDCFGEITK